MTDQALEFAAAAAMVERLQQWLPDRKAPFRRVSAGLAAEGIARQVRPAAFVAVGGDAAAPPPAPLAPQESASLQSITAALMLYLIVEASNDRTGQAALPTLGEMVGDTRALLSGWTPPGALKGLQFARGTAVDVDGSVAVWRDEYRLQWWGSS